MPYQRPTLAQLIDQAETAIEARLPGADARMRRSNLNVIARVMAALMNGTYGYLDYLAQNITPGGMDRFSLVRWGANYGLSPTPAMAATGTAIFGGTAGTSVPSGTVLLDSVGNLYVTTATVALGVGATSIPIAAQSGGDAGNLAPFAPLTLGTAIAGVNATATVDATGMAGGTDIEDTAAFRGRVLARMQSPPGGSGTLADYERWTLAAKPASDPVTRVTVTGAGRGPGTVDIRFLMDNRSNPVPLSGDLAAVLSAVQANAPLTDDIQTIAPIPVVVNYTLSNSNVPAAARALIALALSRMHDEDIQIGDGLSLQGKIIPTIAANLSPTVTNFLVSPSADIAPDPTKVLMLGSITYV